MNEQEISILSRLFLKTTGHNPDEISRLPGAGSNRAYYRLRHNDEHLIGTIGNSIAENEAFIYLSGHFHENGLPVPKVHAVAPDHMAYLQDDLGNDSLFEKIKNGRTTGQWTGEEVESLERAIKLLPRLQWEGAKGLDFDKCYPIPEMDIKSIMWDLNYFKYCFLKATGITVDEPRLESDFETLATILHALCARDTFMFRDFQSRNIMLDRDGNPWLIDFQGGRRGPYHYDVASFLWQAKARIPDSIKEHLIDCYIEASRPYCVLNPDAFRDELKLFVMFRTLQVLGAYGFRGYVEHKPHFLQSIPDAITNLRNILIDLPEAYKARLPYLTHLLGELTELSQFVPRSSNPSGILTVRVNSFGFRKSGIPADPTGNGGGYVFDCRALHNPGRYEEYRQLTGLDRKVADFLETDGGVTGFLEHAFALVDNSVECYQKRGFSDLSVSFGCTGGQHRSVYCADKMADHIFNKYGCRVEIAHIEQGISQTLEP